MTRPIVFLTDYGLADEFVGVCHGAIPRIAPEAQVIDLTHQVARQDVLKGAIVLSRAVGFMPDDAVFLAVVDPGVGSERRAVAVETRSGAALVGPDNGLLSMAWQELGGAERAVEIAADDVLLRPVSRTFHGRDVFAPAAAHLAAGRYARRARPAARGRGPPLARAPRADGHAGHRGREGGRRRQLPRRAGELQPGLRAIPLVGNVLADVGLGAFRWAQVVWFHVGGNNLRSLRAVEKIGARYSHEETKEIHGQVHVHAFYRLDAGTGPPERSRSR